MSKYVYSIDNQEMFNVAMCVGFTAGHKGKYFDKTERWNYDIEFIELSVYVYEKVKGTDYDNETCCKIASDWIESDGDKANLPKFDNEKYDDNDYQDFWYGTECGAYFGVPNEISLAKANETMIYFMNDAHYGYVNEVIKHLYKGE